MDCDNPQCIEDSIAPTGFLTLQLTTGWYLQPIPQLLVNLDHHPK